MLPLCSTQVRCDLDAYLEDLSTVVEVVVVDGSDDAVFEAHERAAPDLLVPRTPPTQAQFFDQRVRQAYDEFARPWRLIGALAIVPLIVVGGRRAAVGVALSSVAVAEVGRRSAGGQAVFGPAAAVWAPCWVAERAVTSWLALLSRTRRGGVRYRGTVLRKAATPMRELRKAYAGLPKAAHGVGASRS